MNRLDKTLRLLLIAVAALHLTACSKTVQWEEEVPLNTGETIWVKRMVQYTIQGDAGNPLKMAYRPEREQAIEFTWAGMRYQYEGEARILLLAISPQQKPVLVAKAADNSWEAVHNYPCTIPYYVQLIPDASGRNWTWPPQIESWLYNLPTNLLLERHSPEKMKKRYTAAEVQKENYPGNVRSLSKQKIDPAYTGDRCRPREK